MLKSLISKGLNVPHRCEKCYMPKFVIWGSYCENVVKKRALYRQAHLERLNQQKERGILITIGVTADLSQVFPIYQAASESEVRELDGEGSVVIILSCKHRKNAYSGL